MPLRSVFGNVLVVVATVVLSGAFLQQIIAGPQSVRDASETARTLNSASIAVAYLFALGGLVLGRRYNLRLMPVVSIPLVFVALEFASTAWALSPEATVSNALTFLFTIAIASAIVKTVDFDRFITLIAATLAIALLVSVLFVYAIPSWGLMAGSENSDLRGMPQGVFRHKNQLADAASLAGLIAVASRDRLGSKFRVLLLILAVYCLMIAGSSNKVLGFAGAVCVFYAWRTLLLMTGSRALTAVVIGWLFVILIVIVPSYLGDLLGLAGKDETMTGRTIVWNYAWTLIVQRPYLGYGAGSIWGTDLASVPGMYFVPTHAHSTYFEVALMLGIVGIAILTTFVLYWCRRLFFDLGATRDRGMFAILLLIASIFRSPFETSMFQNNDLTFCMLLVALGYYVVGRRKKVARRTSGGAGRSAPRDTVLEHLAGK